MGALGHLPNCAAYRVPAGDAERDCTCAYAERERIAMLEKELHEARAGYYALDKNWEAIHNGAMNPIRDALGLPDGSVGELIQAIQERSDEEALLRGKRGLRGALCAQCKGWGRFYYPNTGTWHAAKRARIVGHGFTWGVCDACWGSGDAEHPGVDLRALEAVELRRG